MMMRSIMSALGFPYSNQTGLTPSLKKGTTSGKRTMLWSRSTFGADIASAAGTSSANGAASTADTTTGSVTQPPEDEYLVAVRGLLSRAANVIRESVQCEGVLFLDATIGSVGGLIEQPDSDTPTSREFPPKPPSSGSEEAKQQVTGREELAKLCQILGHSTSDFASIDGDLATLAHLSVPENFLKRLLRRYLEGYIFNFDEGGVVQSGDSSEGDGIADFLDLQTGFGADGIAAPMQRKPHRPLKPTKGDVLSRTFIGAQEYRSHPAVGFSQGTVVCGGVIVDTTTHSSLHKPS